MNNIPKSVESSFRIIEASHKAGNLSSFKCEMKRMIKLLTKATKKIRYEDKSSEMFWGAMEELKKLDEIERNERYEKVFNSN